MDEMFDRASLLRTLDIEMQGLQALQPALTGVLGANVLTVAKLILAGSGRVFVTGMGKSGHIGRKLAATLSSTGTPSHFIHPAEASHGDLGMVRTDDILIAISWSGEAPELADIVAYCRRFGVPLVAITSNGKSALGSAADHLLELPKMPEACPNGLAPTTSTTMQLVIGDVLSICLLEARGFSSADYREYHPGGKLGARLKRARDLMHKDAELPLVSESSTLAQAIIEMSSKRFGVTGVVDADGALTGVLTDGDLRRAFQSGFQDRPIVKAMTRSPLTSQPEMLAAELMGVMNRKRITSVFVVDPEMKPVGILHLHDFLSLGII
jgi:arabinose-5-phosphate isomerase